MNINTLWSTEQEAQHLKVRFEKLKASTGMGQAEFARANGVPGGASLLSQHIKNRRPINLEAAIAYAKGFACPIAEISPRLAKEIESAQGVGKSASDEPATAAWLSSERQEHWKMPNDNPTGYSAEALALAWLLDQIPNRLDKKKGEVEASAALLKYLNAVTPTRSQVEH